MSSPPRSFVALAYADELLADPALLAEYGRTFGAHDDVTLAILAPGAGGEEIARALGSQVDIDADLLILAVPAGEAWDVAAGIDCVYTRRTPLGPFARLPHAGEARDLLAAAAPDTPAAAPRLVLAPAPAPRLVIAPPPAPERSIAERLAADRPRFHVDGRGDAISRHNGGVIAVLETYLRPGLRTLETGSGYSTVVFAASGCEHTAVTPDAAEADGIRAYAIFRKTGDDATGGDSWNQQPFSRTKFTDREALLEGLWPGGATAAAPPAKPQAPAAKTPSKGVFVLGMHRSGVSAAAGVLELLGLPAASGGLVVELDELVLAAVGGSWAGTPEQDTRWGGRADLASLRMEARTAFETLHPGPAWVCKAPTFSLTLPFWREALDADPAVVIVYRNPLETARSLGRRNGVDRELALAVWERSVRSAFAAASGLPVYVVSYEDLLAAPRQTAEALAGFLRGQGFPASDDRLGEIEAFIDPGLRHATFSAGDLFADADVSIEQRELYVQLSALRGAYDALVVDLGAETPATAARLALQHAAGVRLPRLEPNDQPDPPTRAFVALAFADELLESPELLDAYGRAFGASDDLTLAILAPGGDAQDIAQRLGRRAEIEADLMLLAVPAEDAPAVAAGVDHVYTRRAPLPFLEGLPHTSDPAELRRALDGDAAETLAFTCNLCGTPATVVLADLRREERSCTGCGSTPRFRAVVHALSLGLFGTSLPLAGFPARPDLKGIGLTDWDRYANTLAERTSYENTFLHTEPYLDITDPAPAREGTLDYIVATEVFEHVEPPVGRAFAGARRLLKPGGLLLLTVPWVEAGETREHFPDLHDWRIVDWGEERVLVNRRADGTLEEHRNLVFHGGEGAVLEMRLCSRAGLVRELEAAGFEQIEFVEHAPQWGAVWDDERSLAILARAAAPVTKPASVARPRVQISAPIPSPGSRS